MLLRYIKYLLLFIVFSNACASDRSQIMTTNIICDSTEITAVTSCTSDKLAGYPTCQSQEFIFHEKSGKSTSIKSEGLLIKPEDLKVEMLDYIASDWACESGLKSKYLVVRYYNGGNCSECEFHMIYDLNGKKFTKDKTSFYIVAKKLTENENMEEIKIPFHQ